LIDAREHSLRTGEFYTILVEKAEDFDLYGIPV